MPFYRKKPVVIEARRLMDDIEIEQDIAEWCEGKGVKEGLVIHTLEGDHLANYGDYIIKGVQGEFYPCKSDIFNKTYELA